MLNIGIQFFGGRGGGGSGGARGGRGKNNGKVAEGTSYMPRVGSKEVNNWVESHSPGDFLSAAPSSVTLGGVEFNWIGENKSLTSEGLPQYINTYQSTRQANNGEWPVFETVVTQKKRGRKTSYSWDTSTFGTGLR